MGGQLMTISAFNDGRWVFPSLVLLCLLFLGLTAVLTTKAPLVRGWFITGIGIKHRAYAENRVGSHRDNDLRLKGAKPFHGIIHIHSGGELEAQPLDGTFSVNGKKWKSGMTIGEKDRIKAGRDSFSFKLIEPKPSIHLPSIFQLFPAALVSGTLLYLSDKLSDAVSENVFWQVFAGFAFIQLSLWIITVFRIRRGQSASVSLLLAFLLSGLSLLVTAAYSPNSLFIQSLAVFLGVLGNHLLINLIEKEEGSKKLRRAAMVLGAVLLLINLLTASPILGARNWLKLGTISLQPSELVKITLILAGAIPASIYHHKRYLVFFFLYAYFCIAVLLLIHDIGMAFVFFLAFLTMLWISCGVRIVTLTLLFSASLGALAAIVLRGSIQYAWDRMMSWGTAWANPLSSGYQQTRAMMASASGGLYGCGIGEGWFGSVFASGSDMPFAVLSEEIGLLGAFGTVLLLILLIVEVIRSSIFGGSLFCAVSCSAVAAFLSIQTMLNLGGTFDLFPFTGVTLPLLSTGGSSMIACWLMLAFPIYAENKAEPMGKKGEAK